MASYGAFSSKLDAVNTMLSTIGQAGVNQLEGAVGEALDASNILDEVSKAVQTEGWHFNKYYDVELVRGLEFLTVSAGGTTTVTVPNSKPHYLVKGESITIDSYPRKVDSVTDASTFEVDSAVSGSKMFYVKRIGTPITALNVDFSTYRNPSLDPVVRGRFLYDKANNTNEFTATVKAILTYLIPFEQEEAGGQALPEYARRFVTMRAARVFAQRHVGDPTLIQIASKEEQDAYAQFLAAETENADTNILQSPLAYYTVARNTTAPIATLYKV